MASFQISHKSLVLITAATTLVALYAALNKKREKAPGGRYLSASDVGDAVEGDNVSLNSKNFDAYNVIIIGGGTAGCVLASRLSERPDLKVLLLEAGTSGNAILFTKIPSGYPLLFHGEHDWEVFTVPQKHCLNRTGYWPRGRMLGGCSAINAMMFHYGDPADYDEWAKSDEDGAAQWSYANFHQYFRKFEKYSPHPDFPQEASHRGDSGFMSTGSYGHFGHLAKSFIQSCTAAGILASTDVNTSKGSLGVTKIMTYINTQGQRVSTEAGYLTPDVLSRPNLHVVVGAQVTKVLFEQVDGVTRATGVEFADRKNGNKLYRVRSRNEVVLSAGAVHTPHILLHSGVGPANHLKGHGIPVILDLPGVGQGLKDHPVVETMFRPLAGSIAFLKGITFGDRLRKNAALAQWLVTKKGPISTNICEAAAFVRSDDPFLFPASRFASLDVDSSSGPNAPDLEIIVVPLGLKHNGTGDVPTGQLVSMGAVVLRPTSSGSITLRSSNPFDPPLIDPNYLSTQHDVDVLVRGMRLMMKIAQTEPFASCLDKAEKNNAFDHDLHKLTDKQLEYHIRERAETLYHPTSTARMAPLSEGGVVDYYLRVRDIPNLRIADDSILPNIISGHTAGPAIAIGEKAADLIKAAL